MKKLLLTAISVAGISLYAKVTVPGIFSDHAVLQKSAATAVFGKAAPGEKVTVSYGDAKAETVTGKDGRWLVRLDLSKSDGSGKNLVITGRNKIVARDVITGEVWFCTGQSNMALRVQTCLGAKETIAKSANNDIRMFSPQMTAPAKPAENIRGRWLIAGPRTTGNFTAVGYYFARKINKETGKAVGLINPSWGGSSIESWISTEKLLKGSTPAIAASAKQELDAFHNYDANLQKHFDELNAWLKKVNRTDDERSTAPPAGAKWTKALPLNRNFRGNGVIWFRKNVVITKKDITRGKVIMEFGRPTLPVQLFIDGKPVASLPMKKALERRQWAVSVPADMIAPGKHEITLRVPAYISRITFPRNHRIGADRNSMNGWEYCREKNYPALTRQQLAAMPQYIGERPYPSKSPGMIWNGLVYPIIPYTMKGVLWYQGEQNAGKKHNILYGDQIRTLVSDLRERFKNPELRFYAVQLPGYMKKSADPNQYATWPIIRKGQTSAMDMPGTAEAVIIDLGEASDIHPIDKEPVGERLAAIALHNDYGKKVPFRSPAAVKATRSGNAVKVDFKYTCGGLKAKELPDFYWLNRTKNKKAKLVRNSPASQVEGFTVKAKNGKWFWADAKISGNSVIVSSAQVKEPVAVRYAWQNNPTCNLYNGAGFPAGTFELEVK